MSKPVKILAIIGSYRKGGIIDRAVEEILVSAKECGAETRKIWLIDRQLSFCTNCRSCTQTEGLKRGLCVLEDDMESLLRDIDWADGLVVASSMNAGTVTAVMKLFIERLVCFGYWPWGAPAPKSRNPVKTKRAILVASSAAPAVMARILGDVTRLLKAVANLIGARTVGILFIGLAAQKQQQELSKRSKKKARLLGQKLAEGH